MGLKWDAAGGSFQSVIRLLRDGHACVGTENLAGFGVAAMAIAVFVRPRAINRKQDDEYHRETAKHTAYRKQ